MFCGVVVGAIAWAAFHESPYLPNLLLCLFVSAWLGVGARGLLAGEVSIGGRGDRSSKTFIGTPARIVGLMIIFLCAAFVFAIAQTKH
jgi:hypothetical protein